MTLTWKLLTFTLIITNIPREVTGADIEGIQGYINNPVPTGGITAGCFLLAFFGAFRIYTRTIIPRRKFAELANSKPEGSKNRRASGTQPSTSRSSNKSEDGRDIQVQVEPEPEQQDFRISDVGELKNSSHQSMPEPYTNDEHTTTDKERRNPSPGQDNRPSSTESAGVTLRSPYGPTIRPKSKGNRKYTSSTLKRTSEAKSPEEKSQATKERVAIVPS